MNRFTADFSSSVDSTPGREQQQPPQRNTFFSTQLPSTTPIAPPPSQIFGSSTFGTGISKLQFSKPDKSSPLPREESHTIPHTNNGTSALPSNRPFHSSFATSQASEYTDQYDQEFQEGEDEEDMDEDGDYEDETGLVPPAFQSINQMPSLMKFSTISTNGPGQSRISAPNFKRSLRGTRITALPYKGDDTIVANLARDLASRSRPAPVTESDDVILQTEQLLRSLDAQLEYLKNSHQASEAVTHYAQSLAQEWRSFADTTRPTFDGEAIGPAAASPLFTKANYLASLLFTLRHPPYAPDGGLEPTPKVLLEWLDQYHISYDDLARDVTTYTPNSTASSVFWGVAQSLVLRGKFQQVIQLFADADFQYAATAVDDGSEQPGYKGAQLQSTQSVIYRAREVLNMCPAYQTGDWNVAGVEWDLYRTRVEAELDYLNDLNNTLEDDDVSFEAENFGIRKPATSLLAKLGRKSTSTIPWSIYTGLKIIYNILLGSAEEIVQQSQDWLEAVTSLTIWWDGTAEAAVAQWSFDVSRANNLTDAIDSEINPYLQRLRAAFLSVTSPEAKTSELRMNTLSPVEVGLGNILQGNIQGALVIIRTLSQTVAEAIAEVGTCAGWFEGETPARPGGLNDDDLMVLSYGTSKQAITKDEIILGYSEAIFDKPELNLSNGATVEGWEIAISLITRMDDQELMHATVSGFLDQLDVVTQDRAEKLTNLCSDLGLPEEACKVSDRFGDFLVNNTTEYGTALLAYARSHSPNKIRQLVDVLVSYSIVQSRAYPPHNEIDSSLSHLVSNPKTALSEIADMDPQAAELLQFYLVGYACLRRFYSLRDEETSVPSQATAKPAPSGLRPKARRRAAAKTLIAAIESAADSIYGGLYDPDRQSAIQVDGLLPLLGEATALLAKSSDPDTSILTSAQIYALLAAIEDLSTVSSRVYDATEECLQASLRNYHGSQPPSPHAMLKKSMSSGTNSNFSFSMMGSEMLMAESGSNGRSGGGGGRSAMSSGVLVQQPGKSVGAKQQENGRAWDWRANFSDENVSGRDVVRALRIGLAEELSLAELRN